MKKSKKLIDILDLTNEPDTISGIIDKQMEKTYTITWKTSTSRFSSGKVAYVGKIKIGSYHYNGIDRDESLRQVAMTILPGLEPDLGKFPTEQLAMEKVEAAFKKWIELLNS